MDIIVFLIIIVVLAFLAKEFLKKGRFLKDFLEASSGAIEWQYAGGRAVNPGMYNIVISGRAPFSVLIGFDLEFIGYKGYDPYGFAHSDSEHRVVISTYLRENPVRFRFLTTAQEEDLTISSSPEDQKLVPMKIYPPHWWQRLGFLG